MGPHRSADAVRDGEDEPDDGEALHECGGETECCCHRLEVREGGCSQQRRRRALVVPLALFDEGGYLLRSHMLRLVVLEVEETCQLMQHNGKTGKYDLQVRASTAPCQVP